MSKASDIKARFEAPSTAAAAAALSPANAGAKAAVALAPASVVQPTSSFATGAALKQSGSGAGAAAAANATSSIVRPFPAPHNPKDHVRHPTPNAAANQARFEAPSATAALSPAKDHGRHQILTPQVFVTSQLPGAAGAAGAAVPNDGTGSAIALASARIADLHATPQLQGPASSPAPPHHIATAPARALHEVPQSPTDDFFFYLVPAVTLGVSAINQKGGVTVDVPPPYSELSDVHRGAHFCVRHMNQLHFSEITKAGVVQNTFSPVEWEPPGRPPLVDQGHPPMQPAQVIVEVSGVSTEGAAVADFKRNCAAFTASIKAQQPGVTRAKVVHFKQKLSFGERTSLHPFGWCARAVVKISAQHGVTLGVSNLRALALNHSIFCHPPSHFTVQALLDNTIQDLENCGAVYFDVTGYNDATVFRQYNTDEKLIEHYFGVLRNLFAHGSEQGFATGKDIMNATHKW